MKIGYDTRWLERRAPAAGIATYIRALITALLQVDQANEYCLWGENIASDALNIGHSRFTGYRRRGWQWVWKATGAPDLKWVAPAVDLWHFTNFVAPPTDKPFVLTVYDLAFVEHPEFIEPKNLKYLQRFVPDSIARAAQVLTISDTMRTAIIDRFGVPESKVSRIYPAFDRAFTQPIGREDVERVKRQYGIRGDYLITVGTLEPRKNLRGLLVAFAEMKDAPQHLVVVGGHGWLFDETKALLETLGLGTRVIMTGYVSQAALAALYRGARLFVFPSYYEGFGIPLLEAMAAGVPIAASSTSSLPEIADSAALYFEPGDTEAMQSVMTEILRDADLAEALRKAGAERIRHFAWEHTAKETLAVYQTVAGR